MAIGDAVLVVAWLVLAHLAADFVFQTAAIVRAKNGRGRRAVGGLAAHGAIVAACLVPAGLAYGGPGWLFVVWSGLLHVAIDRPKIVLTRRAAAAALADAHRRHEAASPSADHLGRAWTPLPAGLFIADQLAHLAVLGVGWATFLSSAADLQPGWTAAIHSLLGGLDAAGVHRAIGAGVVFAALAIVNIGSASIFVAILVRPVEEAEDEVRWGRRAAAPLVADPRATEAEVHAAAPARRWSIRLGPFDARVEAEPETSVAADARSTAVDGQTALPQAARVGATIGVLERILIVVFVLTGSEAAIGFVVAAKTLARFRLLDDRDFAEYYLLGTLGSVAIAIVTGLVGRAALGVLLA
jgi:Protein of unknown function (DUF3307)